MDAFGDVHPPHADEGASLEERHRTERDYFDAYVTEHWDDLAALKIDDAMVPRNMGKYVEVMSTFLRSRGEPRDLRVLDVGCGAGIMTVLLARHGVQVTAMDLSPKCVEVVGAIAEGNGVGDRVETRVGAIESMPFPDEHFDAVAGTKILHHVEIGPGAAEIHRVLKPGGGAFFWECTYKNPILNLMSKLARAIPGFPIAGTPYEHPLTREEVDLIRSTFAGQLRLYAAPFAFFSHLGMVLTKAKSPAAMARGEAIDRALESIFPFLGSFAFHQILELRRSA